MSVCCRPTAAAARRSLYIQLCQLQSQRHFHPSIPSHKNADHNKTVLRKERAKQRQEEKARQRLERQAGRPGSSAGKVTVPSVPQLKSSPITNLNAKHVPFPNLTEEHLLLAERHVGDVVLFPDEILTQLNTLGMIHEKQGFQYTRNAASVIRLNSGLVARELFAKNVRHLATKDRRVLVSGKGGTGKSFILLQMAALALMHRYVVIAVPRGMDLVDNRTAYLLDEKTMRYRQTNYLSDMLSRTRKACFQPLQDERTKARVRIGREIYAQGTPLLDILEAGVLHPSASQEAFETFLLEMAQPDRPQMLFLFDNISAISVPTQIPAPSYPYRPVHPHRIWIPFFYTCLLNGTLNHPRAAVIAATSQFPKARTLDIALGDAVQEPYEPIDRRIPHSVDGVTIIRAGDHLTAEEAMGLASYYQNAGLLKTVDRLDGINKTVGDMNYLVPNSKFWGDGTDEARTPSSSENGKPDFKRRGRMNTAIVQQYLRRNGITGKDDATDLESTMERLALAGGTARGFWKVCTRMSHF